MAETMIERVGKAIIEEGKNFGALAHHVKGKDRLELRLARAAIEAMRPLPECLDKQGWDFSRDFVREYPLALDAALSEGGE